MKTLTYTVDCRLMYNNVMVDILLAAGETEAAAAVRHEMDARGKKRQRSTRLQTEKILTADASNEAAKAFFAANPTLKSQNPSLRLRMLERQEAQEERRQQILPSSATAPNAEKDNTTVEVGRPPLKKRRTVPYIPKMLRVVPLHRDS